MKFRAMPEAGEHMAPGERVMEGASAVRSVPFGTSRFTVLAPTAAAPTVGHQPPKTHGHDLPSEILEELDEAACI